jgi:hypothetical protein
VVASGHPTKAFLRIGMSLNPSCELNIGHASDTEEMRIDQWGTGRQVRCELDVPCVKHDDLRGAGYLRVHKSDLRPASVPRMGGRRADGGAVEILRDIRISKTRKFLPHPTFSTCQKIFVVPRRACFPPTRRPHATGISEIHPACGMPDLIAPLSRSQCHMSTGRSASNSHDTRQPQARPV